VDQRTLKNLLFEQVARIGKALSSSKRLALLELLGQGEKTVEALAAEIESDVKLTSAHLKALRKARLVVSRREGKYMIYRLSSRDIAAFCVHLRQVAEEHLLEMKMALAQWCADPAALAPVDRHALLEQARQGEVVVIDVRPQSEYAQGHLPLARSMPLEELAQRIAELPADKEIVAYCRGPFCLMSDEAVALLRAQGRTVRKINDGVNEWLAAGLSIETGDAP
jgi:rhodanese-related sulfurtransferase/DNA-binding transcriptional ArsR family regulator